MGRCTRDQEFGVVSHWPKLLGVLPPGLQKVGLAAVRLDGWAIYDAPLSFHDDREVVLAASDPSDGVLRVYYPT